MCVIAFAKKGVAIPTEEKLTQMWKANPDGAGFAYEDQETHKIIYKKGFMTLESLLTALQNPEQYTDTNFAIHFRIGTSGKNDAKTCHPFPLSTDFKALTQTEGETDALLFHNGVLDKGGKANPHSSDTQDFVVAFAPLLSEYHKSKTRDHFISEFTQGNRLLILYSHGRVKLYGDWKKDGELLVSNEYYQYYSTSETSSTNPYIYGSRWWDDWYADYYKEHTPSKSLTDNAKARADKIIEALLRDMFVYVSEYELSLLKQVADDYTASDYQGGTIEWAGYIFGYDKEEGLVWVEVEPEKTEIEEKELVVV